MSTAESLIERSVSHNEIAHAAWTPALADELAAVCEDSVNASNTVQEYWGTTDDGDEWRVHLSGQRKHVTIKVRADENEDDCLQAAADAYVDKHPDAAGYDFSPRWQDDSDRAYVLIDVPTWSLDGSESVVAS